MSEEAIALADEIAMGMAVLRAAALSGEAIQLAVLDAGQPQLAGSAAALDRDRSTSRVIDAQELVAGL